MKGKYILSYHSLSSAAKGGRWKRCRKVDTFPIRENSVNGTTEERLLAHGGVRLELGMRFTSKLAPVIVLIDLDLINEDYHSGVVCNAWKRFKKKLLVENYINKL